MLIAAPGLLSEPADPATPGPRELRRARRSTPPAGTTTTTSPAAARRGDRHRRIARSRPCPQIQPNVEQLTSSSAPRRGSCPTATARSPTSSGALYRRFPALQRAVRARRLLGRELLVPGCRPQPEADEGSPERMRAAPHRASRSPTPSCARRLTPELRVRLQADAALQRVVSGARRSRTSRSSPSGIDRGRAERRSSTADGELHEVDTIVFATGFHVTDMPFAELVRGRDGAHDGRYLERQPAGVPGHDRGRLPEPVHHHRAEHRPRPQLDRLHDRGPARVPDGRAARDGASAARRASRCAATAQERLQRGHPAPHAAARVWNTGGCSSWYIDANGQNTTIWPDYTWRFRRHMRRFDAAAYELTAPGTPAASAAAPASA